MIKILSVGQNIVNAYGSIFTEQGREVIKALNTAIWMDNNEIYDHAKTYLKYCVYDKDYLDMVIIILECITDVNITMSRCGYALINNIDNTEFSSIYKMSEKSRDLTKYLEYYTYNIKDLSLKIWEALSQLMVSSLFDNRQKYLVSLWMAHTHVETIRRQNNIDKNTSIYKEDLSND